MAAATGFDRRWIFLAMGLVVVGLYASGKKADMPVNEYVQSFYDTIEKVPPGSIVMLAADFDPASAAELEPMYTAVVHHLLRRNLRVINVATWPAAPPFTRKAFSSIAPQYHKEYGKDWVELGFMVGDDVAMAIIGQSLKSAYPAEALNKTPYDQVPLLRDAGDNMKGVALLVTMSAGFPGILEWISQVGARYNVPILCGTTAVQTPANYTYYPSQLKGFLGGFTGATEYVQMVARETPEVADLRDENQKKMLVQSGSHMLIILLIVVGNVIYFAGRRKAAA